MAQGLITSQEIVEVAVDDALHGSVREALAAALSEKPEHRIVSVSAFAAGQFGTYLRAIAVIEYTGGSGGASEP